MPWSFPSRRGDLAGDERAVADLVVDGAADEAPRRDDLAGELRMVEVDASVDDPDQDRRRAREDRARSRTPGRARDTTAAGRGDRRVRTTSRARDLAARDTASATWCFRAGPGRERLPRDPWSRAAGRASSARTVTSEPRTCRPSRASASARPSSRRRPSTARASPPLDAAHDLPVSVSGDPGAGVAGGRDSESSPMVTYVERRPSDAAKSAGRHDVSSACRRLS